MNEFKDNHLKVGDRVIVMDESRDFYRPGPAGIIIRIYHDGGCIVKLDPGQIEKRYCYVARKFLARIEENVNWYETEEGKEWLSNQNGIEEQFVQEKQKRVPKMPKIGDRYVNGEEGLEYILAAPTYDEVCLINLTSGDRWDDPVKVVDPFAITEDEWCQICAGDEFVLVE